MPSRIPPERLDEIERRLLKAEAPADFVPVLAKAWGRSKRRVWDYVARVRARLAARAKGLDPEADRELVRGLLLNAYRVAEKGSPKFGPDARSMVQAVKVYAEVTGVAAPHKVEITGRDGGPVQTEAVVRVVALPELDPDPADGDPLAPQPGPADAVPREPGA